MAVQDTMQSLTTVAASNSPAGSDSIANTLDNYLRAIQSILRHTEAQGAALTTTASMSLAAATGGYLHVDGTDAINHLGSAVAGTLRTLVFDDACKLNPDATNVLLPGSATIETAAGDVAVLRAEGSGVWRLISYQPKGTAISVLQGLTASLAAKVDDSEFTGANQDTTPAAGFQKLPGGLIIQFGYQSISRLAAGVTGPVTTTFATSFASTVFAVVTNMSTVAPANYNSAATNLTTSNFELYASFGAAGTYNVYWVAFGV